MSATLTVGAICDRHPTTVCAHDTLGQAAHLLSNSYADAIVAIASAVQRPTVIGIITYRDVVNALLLGNDLDRVQVMEVLNVGGCIPGSNPAENVPHRGKYVCGKPL
jgi:CBS domain-containing protein